MRSAFRNRCIAACSDTAGTHLAFTGTARETLCCLQLHSDAVPGKQRPTAQLATMHVKPKAHWVRQARCLVAGERQRRRVPHTECIRSTRRATTSATWIRSEILLVHTLHSAMSTRNFDAHDFGKSMRMRTRIVTPEIVQLQGGRVSGDHRGCRRPGRCRGAWCGAVMPA